MTSFSDDAIVFFSNTIGQLVSIVLVMVAGIKYLEIKQRKDSLAQAKVYMDPIIQELKAEVTELKNCLQQDRIRYNERIRNLFFRLNRVENIQDDYGEHDSNGG